LRRFALSLLLLLVPVILRADFELDRSTKAKVLATDISTQSVQEIYVPDPCDASSHPVGLGATFAHDFSNRLMRSRRRFAVLGRTQAQHYLATKQLTDCDLIKNPDVLKSFAAEFGVDALLVVSATSDSHFFAVDFRLRDLAGTELLNTTYSEPIDSSNFDAPDPAAESSGWPFLFPSKDMIQPVAIQMRNPAAVQKLAPYEVLISVVIGTDGKVSKILFAERLDPAVEKNVLDAAPTWLFTPAKTADGTPIPMRVHIDMQFHVQP